MKTELTKKVGSRLDSWDGSFLMRDGVRLYTRCILPSKQEGTFPIVFIRDPYCQENTAFHPDDYAHDAFIRRGFALIHQHCRGTGASEGVCIPYQEREDGLDTLALIRQLPFYQGEIYLHGGSYTSSVHYTYLTACPQDVKGAVFAIQTDRMYFRNYRNGCCWQWCNADWWLGMIKKQFPSPHRNGPPTRPYRDFMKRALGQDFPPYTNCLLHDQYDDFWQSDPRTDVVESVHFPVLLIDGWFDFYIDGVTSMWERFPPLTKRQSACVIGPWGHATQTQPATDFYPFENGNLPNDYAVRWFESIRTGIPCSDFETGKINYYSIGAKAWKTAKGESGRFRKLCFSADGLLSESIGSGVCSFDYDPDEPPPAILLKQQINVQERDPRVLTFLSDPFTESIAIFGKARWHMEVSSNCEDTAFYIRLCLVEGDQAYQMSETITTLSHLCPQYQPGEKVCIDLPLLPIAFTLKQGSRIRVDISSFSKNYVPHANVRGHWALVTETKKAHNTVYCAGASLALPLEDS